MAGESEESTSGRAVSKVGGSFETLEGAGFRVRVPFPTGQVKDEDTDPFLLLHEMGPVEVTPGNAVGAPDHPHRGFETVTYIISGSAEHKDSTGLRGKLRAGDVQWMTAGRGVVHSEMPSREIQEQGGRLHGFQLWVNLPRKDKMVPPRYQDVPGGTIPVVGTADGKVIVKVIAGESLGSKAVIDTRTPILYLHFKLQPGGFFEQAIPNGFNVFAYVFEGRALLGSNKTKVEKHQIALFGARGGHIFLANPELSKSSTEILLVGGEPLKEPIARRGPFVMNTRAEVEQAFVDYYNGRMGAITH